MTEATWSDATSPKIDWRMSAALENVPRGDGDVAEVTSLEGAVRAWLTLDPAHRTDAALRLEHPVMIDGASITDFSGDGIFALAERLPGETSPSYNPDSVDDAG
jgi:hypothetical protein